MSSESQQSSRQDGAPSLSVANIMAPDYLWAGLDALGTAEPLRNGVLIVFSQEFQGRIGLFCNRYISGAVVDGTSTSGLAALEQLLSVQSGLVGFRRCFGSESVELKQSLAIDILDLLERRPDAKVSTPGEFLRSQGQALRFGADNAIDLPSSQAGQERPGAPSTNANPARTQRSAVDPTKVPSYLDWHAAAAENPDATSMRSFADILMPALPATNRNPGDNVTDANYQSLVQHQLQKAEQQLERSKQQVKKDEDRTRLDEDLRLFTDLLKAEQLRARTWGQESNAGMEPNVVAPGSAAGSLQSPSLAEQTADDLVSTLPSDSQMPHEPAWHKLLRPQFAVPAYIAAVLLICGLAYYSACIFCKISSLNDGVRQLTSGQPEPAIASFSKAIELFPGEPNSYFFRALAYSHSDKPSQAIADLQTSLDKGEPANLIFDTRAAIHMKSDNYGQAIDACHQALKINPKDPAALRLLAISTLHLGNYAVAAQQCADALQVINDPVSRARLLRAKGFAENQMHDWETAFKDLSDAIDAAPDEWTYLQRADICRAQKLYAKALPDYSKAVDLNHNSYRGLVGRATCEMNTDKADDALADFADALAINPNGIDAYMQRGQLHMIRKEWQPAIEDFQESARLNPYIAEPKEQLALARSSMKQAKIPTTVVPHVVLDKEPTIEMPKDTRSLLRLVYRYMNEGSYDEAIVCGAEAVRREPTNPLARNYLAYAFANRRAPKEAAQQFAALNQLAALDDRDTLMYARCLAQSNQGESAIEVLAKQLKANPSALQIEAELAQLYMDKGFAHQATDLCKDGLSKVKTAAERKMFETIMQPKKEDPQVSPDEVLPVDGPKP